MDLFDYKVKNGKLLRLNLKLSDNKEKIIHIKIYGDFFLYPEHKIKDLEEFIKNKNINTLKEEISIFIKENNIQIIGFSEKDLVEAITDFINKK